MTAPNIELSAAVQECSLILKGLETDAPPKMHEVARRVREGKLTGRDLLLIRSRILGYHDSVAGYVEHGVGPAVVASTLARALPFGPEPAHKYGQGEVDAAVAELAAEGNRKDRLKALRVISAEALAQSSYEPLRWAIEGFFPEGLTMLAASAKAGKTFLSLQCAVATARGLPVFGRRTEQSDVLYLCLDTGELSIQNRLRKMGIGCPPNLAFSFEWPKGAEAVQLLDDYLSENKSTQLVIIDTLVDILGGGAASSSGMYRAEKIELAPLRALGESRHVAIVGINHLIKGAGAMAVADLNELSYGGGGFQATPNCSIAINKSPRSATAKVEIRPRDAEWQEIALAFNPESCTWSLSDEDPAEATLTPERMVVLAALRRVEDAKASELAAAIGKDPGTVSKMLRLLEGEGLAEKVGYGRYRACKASRSGRSSRSDEVVDGSKEATPTTSNTSTGSWEALFPVVDVPAREAPVEIW